MSNICLRKKRAPFTTNKKKANPQRELDEELLAIETVDADSCWHVYRLDEDACKLHIPPQPKLKNCKQNPYCIHRLGFEKIEKMSQSLAEGKSVAEVLVRRNPKEQPCGLVNTGNFCYLNSFLQIWFNDLRFRQSIFDWRPELGWTQPADAKLDIQEVLNCLQRLFITLQNTPFDSTDPKDFINLLRLDNQQQDVQEFHTLFFDTLQRNLELHPNGKQICNTINELFLSRVRQTTFCRRCDNERIAHCEYRSLLLSIDGLSSLDAAIEKFFQPESLTDFKCKCGEKGTTDKLMAFEVLPQVLIIQLIRYVYDSSKEQHRKLKTAISYPRILKANKLKQDAPANEEYELTAVMIHEGPNSHCGHYYDIIRDPLTGKWYSYNDKRVEPEKRLPGYEGNKQPKEITRGTNDQKGCYALIYQRKLPAVKNAKIQLRLPPEEVVRGVCKKLEDDFARQSKEGTLSNELWVNRINQRYTLLNKLIREMEIDKGRSFMKKSEEIAFLPTSLLADLFTKEFDAIKQMHSIEDANAMLQSPNANGHKALCRDESTFSFDGMEHDEANHSNQSQDYTKYEDLYAPEPLSDVDFVLCKHENLPLDALLKGQIKAVRKLGAQRLIKEFNVRFRLRTWDEDRNKTSDETKMEEVTENDGMTPDRPCTSASLSKTPVKNGIINGPAEGTKGNNELIDPLLTGKDLCFECVKELKSQASYRNNLQETEKQLAETLRGLAKRTYDSNRGNPFPSIEPPEKAVWVALEHLKKFKKIALDQMENANDLGMDDDDEPIEKRSKDEEILDDENEQGEMQTPKKKADTREIQLVINVDPEQDQQDGEIITEFHFDSEGNEVKMVGRKEKEQNSDGEVEIIEETKQKAVKFNQDLYCKHGKLSCKTKRAWLTEEEWNKLKSSFIEYCDPIPCTALECPDCLEERNIIDDVRNYSIDQIQALQNDIKTLLNKISMRRPYVGNGRGNKCTHVICGEFVAKMRNLGRGRPKNIFEIPPICQNCLLCNHGLPYLPMAHENDEEAAIKLFPIFRGKTNELEHAKGIPILEAEWRDLVNAYKKHVPEQIQPAAILLQENGHYLDFCDDCHLEFLRGEEMKRYIYPEGANIFIRVQRDDTDGQSGASTLMTTRRCVQKNLIKLKMRSDQTILDLKMDLMQQVRQSPIDQLLYLDERVLDNDLTLEASRVPANNQDNPLTLILQQHSAADESLGANGAGPRQPEKGFQDTALA